MTFHLVGVLVTTLFVAFVFGLGWWWRGKEQRKTRK